MQKSAISLIFVSILLGGIILSTALVDEPTSEPELETEPEFTKVSSSERAVRGILRLRQIVKLGGKISAVRTVIGGGG